MAYNIENLAKLEALKALAARTKRDYEGKFGAIEERMETIEQAGGEPNVITSVKVNGEAQDVTDKAVNIMIPTKVSDLTNDSKYQTDNEVTTAIQTAIANTGHASFQKIDAVPAPDEAQENVLYLVMNSNTKHYDIYAKVGETVELLDDTSVDLTNYVEKEESKGLYPAADSEKLAGIADGATKAEKSDNNGKIKINGEEIEVYKEPEDVVRGTVATAAEVGEMLNDVFGVPTM